MKDTYEDIINLPNHKSKKHPHMPRSKRAAQFAPFAALTGHEEAVIEARQIRDKRIELAEDEKIDLNEKLLTIKESINDQPEVSFTYFQEEGKKDKGFYISYTGHVKAIDEYGGMVVMANGRKIFINDILEISCGC